ncbi:uncharacterized protein LOC135491263 [Lineus longissimus]|uniref:uncharacterized protein LOC135491263 n=1 Tax=Lineus longissimus TaxID=88925 RepID=UPI002B4EB880
MPKSSLCKQVSEEFWKEPNMVLKKGRCGLNSGATIRMAGFSKLRSRLAAEQHCIIISKTAAKKPDVQIKHKRVINLQDDVDIDDGNLEPHTPHVDMYTVNKRKRWTIADAVEDYIEDHAEDASRVVLVKREAMTSCIKQATYGFRPAGLLVKQTDCTSRHDSKAVVRHSFPRYPNRASSATDLKEKAFQYDTDALRKEVKFPKRTIHNQHARGVQRSIHHPKEGYSFAKKTAIKEHLENWKKENITSKVEDEFDTIEYEVMEPKEASVVQHNWLHQNAWSNNRDYTLVNCVRNKSAKHRAELRRLAEYQEESLHIPSCRDTDDKYGTTYLAEDDWEDDWCDNDYVDEEDYMYLSRSSPCRTIGDELFDLISDVEQKQRSECEMEDLLPPCDVVMDDDEAVPATGNGALGDLKACTSGHPNSLMGVPTRWYPKGKVVYQQEKESSVSGDSDDSGVSLGSNLSLESLQEEETEKKVADTPVDYLAYQPPKFVSCSIPFLDIQPTSLSERYGERFMEGESLPRKFSIQIPGPTLGENSAEIFVLFEEPDDSHCAMGFDTCSELGELFTKVNFHVVGNFGESAKLSINEELFEAFGEEKQTSIADVIDNVVDILQRLPVDSFPTHKLTKPKAGSEICRFHTLSAVNRWKHEILDPDAAFEIIDKRTASLTESSKELVNLELVDVDVCGVCYEPVNGDGAVPATTLKTCLHAFCNDCWVNHLVSRVRQGDVRLTCPGFKCKVLVDHMTLMSLLPWDVFKLHIQHVRDAFIERSGDLSWCPREKCDQIVVSKSAKKDQGQNVACRCGEVWCFNCQQRPHWPATCKQAAEYSRQLHKNGDDKAELDPVHKIEGKRCPHCSHPIEKNGGCPYMFCSRCNHSFCWTCGKEFGPRHWPCSEVPNETFNLIDHFPGRKRFYVLATMTRSKRVRQASLCRVTSSKKTRLESSYQVMRKFRKTAIHSETRALWNELNYTIEYSYVVMYFANRRVRSRTIAGSLSMIDNIMEELKDLVTLYACRQCNSKEYAKRLEGIKNRGTIMMRHLRLRLGNQQALIAGQHTS